MRHQQIVKGVETGWLVEQFGQRKSCPSAKCLAFDRVVNQTNGLVRDAKNHLVVTHDAITRLRSSGPCT